jgi:predicted phosphoribosyltransferase
MIGFWVMGGFLDGILPKRGEGPWHNRYEAGRNLAVALKDDVAGFEGKGVVLGLPRGGLVVGLAVANDLKLPLDFRAVKKVGHPYQPEFAIGAVDISGVWVRNPSLDPQELPSEEEFERMVGRALEQARSMEKELRGDGEPKYLNADWCLVVDDGAATGLTLLAVARGLKSEGRKVHIAVPVTSVQAKNLLSDDADSFFALEIPSHFMAVSQFYIDFAPVSTQEARNCLIG